MADKLDVFSKWAAAHWNKTNVLSMLRCVANAKEKTSRECCTGSYVRGFADALGVEDFPDNFGSKCCNPSKKQRLCVSSDGESDDEDEGSKEQCHSEGDGGNTDVSDCESVVDPGTPASFVKGLYYSLKTQNVRGEFETSYFRADNSTDITWLYTVEQVRETFTDAEVPQSNNKRELYISDHYEINFVPGVPFKPETIHKKYSSCGRYIAGFCKTTHPAFVYQYPQKEVSQANQAEDYTKVLLSRGSYSHARLHSLVKTTPRWTYKQKSPASLGRCSACGLSRNIKYDVLLGDPNNRVTLKMGRFCYDRVKLAWNIMHSKNVRQKKFIDQFKELY